MIGRYISEIETRLNIIAGLIEDSPEVLRESVKTVNEKVDEIMNKIKDHKDYKTKQYELLTGYLNRHVDVLEEVITADKTNILLEEMDELKQTAELFKKIENLLPAIDAKEYLEQRPKFENIEFLATTSTIQLSEKDDTIKVCKYESTPLRSLQNDQRSEMSAILELNYRMLNNLNKKIESVYHRKISSEQ